MKRYNVLAAIVYSLCSKLLLFRCYVLASSDISSLTYREDIDNIGSRALSSITNEERRRRSQDANPIRIRTDPADWTDPLTGTVWLSDRFYVNGFNRNTRCPANITNTVLDPLYCTARFFLGTKNTVTGSYNIPVRPGQYTLNLMFSELYKTSVNERKFDVLVQGNKIETGLDVFARAPGMDTAFKITTAVTVPAAVSSPGTGRIKIEFVNVIGNAFINAIEVLPSSYPEPSPVMFPFPTPAAAPTAPMTAPLALPLPTPIPAPVASSGIYRIDCGARTSWTDSTTGLVWISDANFARGGVGYANCPADIAGTDKDTLYCTERVFFGASTTKGSYVFPVQPGQYTVTLMFAEIFFDRPKRRVFDVLVQGNLVKADLDIFTEVGKNQAYDITIVVNVTSATLNIDLVNKIQNSKINAIYITPGNIAPTPKPISPVSPAPFPAPAPAMASFSPSIPLPLPVPIPGPSSQNYLIDCGANIGWTDPTTGLIWSPDDLYALGGFKFANCPAVFDDTDKDTLYCTDRVFFGPPTTKGSFVFPVVPGQYTVTLMFAETFFDSPKQRVFDVMVQGTVIKAALDIVDEVGKNTAYDITTILNVTSTNINIDLVNKVENSKINAIYITPGNNPPLPPKPVPPSPVRINAGSDSSWTDPATGFIWSADKFFVGGGGFNACPKVISGTDQDDLFCSERSFGGGFDSVGTYKIPLSPGVYKVNLMFAEIFWGAPNDRIFKVLVQGKIVAPNVDLVELVGPNVAYIVSETAVVQPVSRINYLTIELVNIVQNAQISAIEVIPDETPPGPPPVIFPPIRINCGYNKPYVDTLGQTWRPDQNYTGGSSISKIVPIASTDDDTLYHFERIGDLLVYNFTVPPGLYAVKLFFAETYYTLVGQRVFDVQVGPTIVKDYDILAGVAASTATNRAFVTLVDDGSLIIRLSKSNTAFYAGPPKLNAIEIKMDLPHVAHSVANGPYFGTDIDNTGKGKVKLRGEKSHTHGVGLYLTNVQWKEGTEVLGNTLNIDRSFTIGNHTVSLYIKDNGNNEAEEVTTISVREFGFPAITGLLPESGSIVGGYNVTISGAGFNYPASSIVVTFGVVELTGPSAIQVIDSNTITLVCPPSLFGQIVNVVVTTPRGTSEPTVFKYTGSFPIDWSTGVFFSYLKPTVGRFGPDRKLYVGTQYGKLIKLTMNADFTQVLNSLVANVNMEVGNTEKEVILGLGFDPMDQKEFPDVYFTSNWFFHKGTKSSSGSGVNGRIRMASGPNLETIVDVMTGLPVSDHDHGLNGIEFGDNGELYFLLGSNTNGGIPGPLSGTSELKENFLSAACNVAYLSHPNFNGTIKWSAPDDGNMIASGIDVFAHGIRNPFGLALHSNGKLYATDNGPNEGFGAFSTGCGASQQIPEYNGNDELNYLQKGKYYGSPNRKRASYFSDPRQCVYHPAWDKGTADYTAPLVTGYSSQAGVIEFHGEHFGGQLRHNLIVSQYLGSTTFHRVILNEDGTDVVIQSKKFIPLEIGLSSLDITQAPNGNLIDFRYAVDSIAYYKPVEPPTTQLVVKTAFPRRGPNGGGNKLSIYGVNFGTSAVGVTVTVGTSTCPITAISMNQIDCTLSGGTGTVDVVVSKGVESSTFAKSYRYISGTSPPGFVLPVYTG